MMQLETMTWAFILLVQLLLPPVFFCFLSRGSNTLYSERKQRSCTGSKRTRILDQTITYAVQHIIHSVLSGNINQGMKIDEN